MARPVAPTELVARVASQNPLSKATTKLDLKCSARSRKCVITMIPSPVNARAILSAVVKIRSFILCEALELGFNVTGVGRTRPLKPPFRACDNIKWPCAKLVEDPSCLRWQPPSYLPFSSLSDHEISILITLIFYRFTFVKLMTVSLTPPYWINMGAVAITTLAGARLIIAAPAWSFLGEISPFLKGFTLFFWATGTWWIPLLFILGIWRHLRKHFPLVYDPLYWGMVFPLGMYTVCTLQLSKAIRFEPLLLIPRYFVFVALAAWLATFIGLVWSWMPHKTIVGTTARR